MGTSKKGFASTDLGPAGVAIAISLTIVAVVVLYLVITTPEKHVSNKEAPAAIPLLEDGPEGVAASFFTAIHDNDCETISATVEIPGPADCDLAKNFGTFSRADVLGSSITGNTAVVMVNIIRDPENPVSMRVFLVHTPQGWKVSRLTP